MELLLSMNWIAVGQIVLIDILLGGDNAIVIALACRNLPPKLRRRGIFLGTFGAIAIRVILIAFAVTLLQVPYLKLLGGVLLFWIGIKLLLEDEDGHGEIQASDKLFSAVKTIIVADLVMSVDNVIAVAGAAEHAGGEHRMLLVIFGIFISIPIIIWGSTIVLKLMERFPIIVTLGAALLGYIAGGMAVTDAAARAWIDATLPGLDVDIPGTGIHFNLVAVICACAVVLIGKAMMKRRRHTKT